MLNGLKYVNLAFSFLLELLMLAAFAYWGWYTGSGTVVKIILAIGVPLVAATVWGIFLAPRSTRRLTGLPYLIVAGAIFGLAALGLAAAEQPGWGLALALAFVINHILLAVLGDTIEPAAQ